MNGSKINLSETFFVQKDSISFGKGTDFYRKIKNILSKWGKREKMRWDMQSYGSAQKSARTMRIEFKIPEFRRSELLPFP